jgi:hypothetical protein
MEVATDYSAFHASPLANSGPPRRAFGDVARRRSKGLRPRIREGEVGCVFEDISNLVEPTERSAMGEPHAGERRDMEGAAGP